MAIYHCSIKIINRRSGRTAVASAAYRSGERLYDKETGILHDFTKKSGVVFKEILLPYHAPDRFKDREFLWNDVQMAENRKDAQLAREIEIAFPAEFDRKTQLKCARDYIDKNFVSDGMIADWALHDKGDGNPHAHIMLTTRKIDDDGSWLMKQSSFFANTTDENGDPAYDDSLPVYDPKHRKETEKYRIPLLDENGNQKVRIRKGKGVEKLWARINAPYNRWSDRDNAEKWRKAWADECNKYLEQEHRIDHRSYKRQGIDLEPTVHEGVSARKIEKDGKISDRCQLNRNIKKRNSILKELLSQTQEMIDMITAKARTIIEAIRIRRSSEASEKQRRYFITDWLFGGKTYCLREESDRHREAAERIDGIKRQAEQTDKDFERRKRDLDEEEQYIDDTKRFLEIHEQNIGKAKRDAEQPVGTEELTETETQEPEEVYVPLWNFSYPEEEEYVPRL